MEDDVAFVAVGEGASLLPTRRRGSPRKRRAVCRAPLIEEAEGVNREREVRDRTSPNLRSWRKVRETPRASVASCDEEASSRGQGPGVAPRVLRARMTRTQTDPRPRDTRLGILDELDLTDSDLYREVSRDVPERRIRRRAVAHVLATKTQNNGLSRPTRTTAGNTRNAPNPANAHKKTRETRQHLREEVPKQSEVGREIFGAKEEPARRARPPDVVPLRDAPPPRRTPRSTRRTTTRSTPRARCA